MVSKVCPAIGIEAYGPVTNLKLVQLPLPALSQRDLLIRIQAIAFNPIDYLKRQYPICVHQDPSPSNPHVLGWDASGIVEEVGSEVKFYKKGDEVFFAGDASRPGCNAQFMVIDERIVGVKPKSLNWAEAAGLPLTALTVWEALAEQMNISLDKEKNKHKTILFVAGAGGVGSIGIQLAKTVFGLTVVATASRKETVDFCKKMGADYVINHKNNLKQELENLGLKGVDYVLNGTALTEALFGDLAEITFPRGVIIAINLAPGAKYDLSKLFVKRITIGIEFMFSRAFLNYELEKQKEILDNVSKLIDDKKIVNTVTKVEPFSLENVKAGHNDCEKGTNIGKTALEKVQEYFSSL